jgi:hypothetical protein
MAQQQPVQEDQVGGTPVTSTGIDSVDDHIARLKANARQHVDAQVQADSQPRAGGGKTRERASTFAFLHIHPN